MNQVKRIFAKDCNSHDFIFDDFAQSILDGSYESLRGEGVSEAVIARWRGALIWLVSALYDAHCHGLKSVILPLGKKNFSGAKFGEQATKSALEFLKDGGWIFKKIAPAGLKVDWASEIFTTTKLRKMFKRTGFVWTHRQYNKTKEVVIVREKDDFLLGRVTLPTPETNLVRKMRKDTHEINIKTSEFAIFPYLPDPIIKRLINGTDKKFCNFSNVTYRRIFAMGRLDRGGRFYGGWWQQIPSGYRSYIRIDGEPTVELDFGATVVTLLYSMRQVNLPPDPYDLGINPKGDPQIRDIIKMYIIAWLYSSRRFGLPKEDLAILGLTQNELRSLVLEKHNLIKDDFGTGIGLKLMFTESMIARQILMKMLAKNIPVLGIHDGFITQAKHRDLLCQVMVDSFESITGVTPVIKPVTNNVRLRKGSYSMYDHYHSVLHRSAL